MKQFFGFFIKHKIISIIIFFGLISLGLWKFGALNKILGKTTETRYVLVAVEKGSVITSISGTGQISSLDEITIKSKASGDVTYLGATAGENVSAGKLLLKIDNTDALDAAETARDNLENAKVDLEKMKGITTDVGTLRGVKEKAQADLDKACEDGFNSVSNVFLGLPTVIAGLQSILLSYSLSPNQWNIDYYMDTTKIYDERVIQYREDAYNKYQAARTAYDKGFQEYKATSRLSDEKTIETLISDTYETVKLIADSVKSSNNLIQFYQDTLTRRGYTAITLSNTHLSSLNTYTGNTNSYLSNLLSAKITIQSDKEALIETDYTIADQEDSIKNLEKTLKESEDNLADYVIYSPLSGTISAVNIKKGDTVSNGATIGTLISKKQIAEITLNEVDVANVKIGQKATLTFDAIEDLTITGTVAEVNTAGTVSQGVVSYTIKIFLDTQNDKIKPGMSVSASIITDSKQDVLTVSSSAIKTNNEKSYVLVPASANDYNSNQLNNTAGVTLKNAPIQQEVTTGLADDTSTEILTGLNEGNIVITRTISASAKSTSTSSSSSSSSNRGIMNMGGGQPIRIDR